MSRILIIGGSGFIGSHVVDKLLDEKHDVTIYDIDTPRYGQSTKYIRADLLDLQRLIKASEGMEFIYNLAAEANVNRFLESPIYSNLITSHGVLNVLEAAKINKVGRVIQASTEWIYGSVAEDGVAAITEETPYAPKPDHLYTSSKIAAELFIQNYSRLFQVPYTIMRYGIPFGERARAETVTPIFIRKILRGEEITIHGDGSQTRQFVYVKDLAAGNVACLKSEGKNEIFNINGTKKISVIEIVRTLERILKKTARVKHVEDRAGNFKGRFISSEKAKKLLEWSPKYNYEEAMTTYAEWFLKNEKY
jgi:UDP-glucose 4-epimerase